MANMAGLARPHLTILQQEVDGLPCRIHSSIAGFVPLLLVPNSFYNVARWARSSAVDPLPLDACGEPNAQKLLRRGG